MPWLPTIRPLGVAALLLAVFFPLCTPAKDSWVEVRSPNFTVICNSGEKEARRIADQFEQFREVFHNTLPQLRLDLGKPLIIFAVKNEDSLKLLLPGFWEIKGHLHPAGIYVSGEERHFVAVRTNIEGENPYEVVYHEYTHAIMNLNFRDLPVWMGEGLAEFYGNSTIHEKNIQVGNIPLHHLRALQEHRPIPIDQLLTADHRSPYYNEENRAGVFYAESWAIVHYLMMDPDARKRGLLKAFLTAWDKDGDQVAAAQNTFGDLKRFAQAMEAYARQNSFYHAEIRTSIHGDPKSYSSRELSSAEGAADRALFYVHTRRSQEALASIDQALHDDPNCALAYEAQGLLAYTQGEFIAAEESFSKAIALNSSSSFPYYFDAQAQFRHGLSTRSDDSKLISEFSKAISIDPQFAPAYAALASVYSLRQETYQKAIDNAAKAAKLEPGNLSYAINYAHVLLNIGKIDDAKDLSRRITQAAKKPMDVAAAASLEQDVSSREQYNEQKAELQTRLQRQADETAASQQTSKTVPLVATSAPDSHPAPVETVASHHANDPELAIEGVVASAECNQDSAGKVMLTVNHVPLKFVYLSLKALQIVGGSSGSEDTPACADWKGKKVRLYFYDSKGKPATRELDTIQFLR